MKKIIFLSFLGWFNLVSASTLNIDGLGNLVGVSGLDINGDIWNASFIDGSYLDVDSQIMVFSEQFAEEGSRALALAINDTSVNPIYTTTPSSTLGCESIVSCNYITITGETATGGILYKSFVNLDGSTSDGLMSASFTNLTVNRNYETYVSWEPVAAIPTPAAVWLMGSGLIGLVGMRKKSAKLSALSA